LNHPCPCIHQVDHYQEQKIVVEDIIQIDPKYDKSEPIIEEEKLSQWVLPVHTSKVKNEAKVQFEFEKLAFDKEIAMQEINGLAKTVRGLWGNFDYPNLRDHLYNKWCAVSDWYKAGLTISGTSIPIWSDFCMRVWAAGRSKNLVGIGYNADQKTKKQAMLDECMKVTGHQQTAIRIRN
jgi:hypothetical protein